MKPGMRSDLYAELFKQYQSSLYLYLYRMCGSQEIAEELVQETFYRAMVSMKTKHADYARAWLYKVARHLFIDWYRKHRGEMEMNRELEKQCIENTYRSPEEVLVAHEQMKLIEKVIKKLPEQYRTVLLLREMNELSYKELCEILDMTMSQVKVTLFRARARFKEEMLQMKGENE
jgi:RNA polymerase sigma-70 factor (ECF subfamily)